ncbi:MAG: divalent metal cation transporter [Actinobacteria bacterium HGW-Actinobacteria-2]|nr:MAG: divalent metal cation transporter [Actinobacteria bacterium HGW-Actinobacteria-2]
MTSAGKPSPTATVPPWQWLRLLGPAFVASVAYVDPGNVAANLSAGGRYGYALVWVLAAASLMAMVIQYQSAKLGLVSGRTLPQLMTERFARSRLHAPLTWGYGLQAFVIAIATDVAEVVGGALGLNLLFGVPLWFGGVVVGLISLALLAGLRNRGEHAFEYGVGALLALVALGFLGTLFFQPPDWSATAQGLLPQVPDRAAWPLIAAMLGATVMPHAIYLHSGLAIDRFRPEGSLPTQGLGRLLRVQRIDVVLALVVSGSVNVAMLLLGATLLDAQGGGTIEAAHASLVASLGPVAAAVFAIGLLASGIGSAVVGTHAGSRILKDMHLWQVSPLIRRSLTIAPAVLLLLLGAPPTSVLIWSQVVLSFGIAFAAIPLAIVTADRAVMGSFADRSWQRVVNWTIVTAIVALNLITVWWALSGS